MDLEGGGEEMRKRDALRMALRLPEVPESEKLYSAGLGILAVSSLLALVLMMFTCNWAWFLLFVVGVLIFAWFRRASEIVFEWETRRYREGAERR